jgi:hypothetical protein
MPCPPDIAKILAAILSTGLMRIRALAWNGNASRCAVEADHLHNLPALLTAFNPELLDYYWTVERPAYIKNSAHEDAAGFERWWRDLASHVGASTEASPPAR